MIKRYTAFTLIESLLALTFAAALGSLLLAMLVSFKQAYQRITATATLLDDGRFAVTILRRHIHAATAVHEIIPYAQLTSLWQKRLKSRSDVLVLDERVGEVAYYIAQTSWQQHHQPVLALFEKPLATQRQELVAHVVALHFRHQQNGVAYDLAVSSQQPALRQQWHGFAIAGGSA